MCNETYLSELFVNALYTPAFRLVDALLHVKTDFTQTLCTIL